MRKVRREIVKTINDYRSRFQRPQIYLDANTNAAAYEYAKYLLKERAWDNPDEGVLEELCQAFKLIPKQKAIVGFSHLDDDAASGDPTKMAEFMDASGSNMLESPRCSTSVDAPAPAPSVPVHAQDNEHEENNSNRGWCC